MVSILDYLLDLSKNPKKLNKNLHWKKIWIFVSLLTILLRRIEKKDCKILKKRSGMD